MLKIMRTINKIECEHSELNGTVAECLHKFYLQLAVQPIQFTTAGFYVMNLPFLASVFKKLNIYLSI